MSKNINRIIKLEIPGGQSAFLWGARQTGKTTLLKQLFPHASMLNLLDTDLFADMTLRPSLLRELVLASIKDHKRPLWIIDEVQKVPALMDEVHLLIEEHHVQFLLCGSSARKLKRGHANMLGGRAWKFELFPLVSTEIENFDLLRALRHGLIPNHYLSSDPKRSLRSYIATYLKEEIRDEGLTRNLPAFSRFLDSTAYCCGEILNYSAIASDVGVDAKTVREFFQITVDTHVGVILEPWVKSKGRALISAAPKFYWFDVGIENVIARREFSEIKGDAAGEAFETFLLMELRAAISYLEIDSSISFWRTKTKLEVDFIVERGSSCIAIEAKISNRLDRDDYKGLIAFSEDAKFERLIIVCQESKPRHIQIENKNSKKVTIEVLPWRIFLDDLWAGKII